MKVTDLRIGESLTIISKSGNQKIVWMKKADASSIFKYRRYHYKGKKLVNVMDNHKLGSAENLDLEFLLDTGWKRV